MNLNGMNLNIGLMVAGVVLAGSGMATGQAVKFEPTLEAGKRYTLKIEQQGASQMTMGDLQMEQKVSMLMVNQIEAKKAEGDDVALAMKSGRLKMELDVLGQKMQFDSESPGTAHPMLGGMVKGLADSSLTALLKADGTVADVKIEGGSEGGGANPLGNIGLGPEIMAELLKSSLGEGFPDEAVEPGTEWDYGLAVPMAQMNGRKVAAR
ncbi:MAG: DUF6263 family protein, partial [Verrucomicrobiales bacterium]|nr:DUF6263 family protein [Verrucomicrobiales bacterium]